MIDMHTTYKHSAAVVRRGREAFTERVAAQRKYADCLFKIALLTIPFDNLFFAPSKGWATISPFLFLAYVFFNLRRLRDYRLDKNLLAIAVLGLAISSLGWIRYGMTPSTVMDSYGTLFLGIVFYFALRLRYEDADDSLYNSDGSLLFKAYFCAFLYGLAWYACSQVSSGALSLLTVLETRHSPRLHFTFTEPSFTSMHVFGVLLLYTCLIKDERLAKKMTFLGLAFVAMTLFANSSGRCTIDVGVFALLLLTKALFFNGGHVVRNFFLLAGAIGFIALLMALSPRVAQIFANGVDFYSDGSLASRWFRVQAAVHAFISNPLESLLGYGAGNLVVPLHEGYDYAYALYTSSYTAEVFSLKRATVIESLFCGPVKLISDFGLLLAVLFIAYFFKRMRGSGLDPFVVIMTMWLYVQFDSYAFYSIWLLLFLSRPEIPCVSYFQRVLDIFSGTTARLRKRGRQGLGL